MDTEAGAPVRVRTLATLAVGAGIGAGVMYLLDPDSGEKRRAELRRGASRQVREGAITATKAGIELGRDVTTAALDGYREARSEAEPPT